MTAASVENEAETADGADDVRSDSTVAETRTLI